jgi:hypothetical protein
VAEAGERLRLEPFDVDLDEARRRRAIRASSVVSGTVMRAQAWSSQPGAPRAAATKSSEAVDTVGLSMLSLRSTVPAAPPSATGSMRPRVAAVEQQSGAHQRGLRLDPRPPRRAGGSRDAVADVSAGVEHEVARLDEARIEPIHRGAGRRLP